MRKRTLLERWITLDLLADKLPYLRWFMTPPTRFKAIAIAKQNRFVLLGLSFPQYFTAVECVCKNEQYSAETRT